MAGREVAHDGGDALARRGQGLARVSGAQADADGGRDGAVDTGLPTVRVDDAAFQRGDSEVEGAHGVGGAQHEGPARRGCDGPRQVEHRAPGTGGEQGFDTLARIASGLAHARRPLGLSGADRLACWLEVVDDDRCVARDVHPRGMRIDDGNAHVGAREQGLDRAGQRRTPGHDDRVDLSPQRRSDEGLLEGGHSPAAPRARRRFGEQREARGLRPLAGERRGPLTSNNQPGGGGTNHALPAYGHGERSDHLRRARDERRPGLVPRGGGGTNGGQRIAEGDVDLHGAGRSTRSPAGGRDRARQVPNEGGRGLLRLQVNARAHVRAEEACLIGRLGRSNAAQFAGAVGAQDQKGQARV